MGGKGAAQPYREELRRAKAALRGPAADPAQPTVIAATLANKFPSVERLSALPAGGERSISEPRASHSGEGGPPQSTAFDEAYDQGLALQQRASEAAAGADAQLSLLTQACERYEAALAHAAASHSALYNWGVALSDMARILRAKDPQAAHAHLVHAAEKYATAHHCDAGNVQALNNWGLVLQDLCATPQGAPHRPLLIGHSVAKFRRALRLRPAFDRATYNLGTTLHAHAGAQQAAAQQGAPQGQEAQDGAATPAASSEEAAASFRAAAMYVVLAHVLQPSKAVYRTSAELVRAQLPLPCLKTGLLRAVPPQQQRSVAERWETQHFFLDHAHFRSAKPAPAGRGRQSAAGGAADTARSAEGEAAGDGQPEQPGYHRIALADIADVAPCWDPSLPGRAGFWVSTQQDPGGMFFVADEQAEAEEWVDALLLGSVLVRRLQRGAALQRALAPPALAPDR